jgi:hypothetical protein
MDFDGVKCLHLAQGRAASVLVDLVMNLGIQ